MARMGFIQDKLEIKFLHSVHCLPGSSSRCPFEAMQELAMMRRRRGLLRFLRVPERSGHDRAPDAVGGRALRHHGQGPAQQADLRIQPSLLRAARGATRTSPPATSKLRRKSTGQRLHEITPRPNGTYTVRPGAVCDEHGQPASDGSAAGYPREDMAKPCRRSGSGRTPERLYASVINAGSLMSSEPEEESEYTMKKGGRCRPPLSRMPFHSSLSQSS